MIGAYLSLVAWIGPIKPLSELTMDVIFLFCTVKLTAENLLLWWLCDFRIRWVSSCVLMC